MDDFQKQLLKRLDLIIRLQLDRGLAEKPPSTTSVVHRLFDLGLSAGEVAPIIGRPINYITAISSGKKSKSKRTQNKGR